MTRTPRLTIDHVNIVVQNLELSVQFYRRVLGMEKTFEVTLEGDWIAHVTGLAGSHARCVFLSCRGQDFRLELLQYLSPRAEALPLNSLPHTPGMRHIAFETDDMDGLVTRLGEAGAKFVSPPVTVPFPVGEKKLKKRLCYFHDPEGVLLEVAEYSADAA
jgi:catechol 2,3-dioxygenase-like lactoylglutathione lyase family enzyme